MSDAGAIPWRNLPAGQGWGWFVGGVTIWARAPWRATVGMGVIAAAWLVLAMIPILGPLAIAWLTPPVGAGMLRAVHDTHHGEQPEPRHWLYGFREPALTGALLKLGGVFVLAGVIGNVLGLGLMAALLNAADAPGPATAGQMLAVGGVFLAWLAYTAVAFLGLVFTVPLLLFSTTGIGTAIRTSFRGAVANLGPLIILGIIYLPLGILATVPLMLGHLVLIPIMAGAVYAAHRDIFGHRAEAVAQAEQA